MNTTRIKALAKLTLLLGVPLALLAGLFSTGVYVGVQNRAGILAFEHNWLGIDVEVPGAEDSKAPGDDTKKPDGETPDGKATPTPAPTKEPPSEKSGGSTKVGGADTKATPTPTPGPETHPKPEPAVTGPKPSPYRVATPGPMSEDGERQLLRKRRIRVKVLVDRAIIQRGGDWISDVQDTVRWTSEALDVQVGVQLELVGVVTWYANTLDMTDEQLRDNLESHVGEGADAILGFTNRSLITAVASATPKPPAARLGSLGLVYSEPEAAGPRVHGLLYAIGEMLGAQPIALAEHPDWIAGSWMSGAPLQTARPLTLDAANQRRILERKQLEFTPVPESTSTSTTKNDEGERPEAPEGDADDGSGAE